MDRNSNDPKSFGWDQDRPCPPSPAHQHDEQSRERHGHERPDHRPPEGDRLTGQQGRQPGEVERAVSGHNKLARMVCGCGRVGGSHGSVRWRPVGPSGGQATSAAWSKVYFVHASVAAE